MNSETLKEFRQAAYELLVKAKDATFELMDAVMTTRNAACLAEFALSPLFNRQWFESRAGIVLPSTQTKSLNGNAARLPPKRSIDRPSLIKQICPVVFCHSVLPHINCRA